MMNMRKITLHCLLVSVAVWVSLPMALAVGAASGESNSLAVTAGIVATPLPATALQTFEPDSLASIVAAERGHPFWLVIWDLDCPYCMKSMRHIAARQKTDAGLRVITVTTDDMEQADAVRQRLQDIGIQGPAWVFGEASAQALRFAIDPAWRGEKPRAYYYDASGQRKAYSGVIDLDKFKP